MISDTIRRAFLTPFVAVLMLIAAPDLHAMPAMEANTIVLKDFHFSPISLTVSAARRSFGRISTVSRTQS